MREPSPSLVRLLERLHLATADSLREAAPRVAKLAGDLPDFDSVWVDALVQLRRLTPLQAARVNAGRGDTLLCGDYLITHALAGPYYAECFAARHRETGTNVRLYCVEKPQASTAETVQAIAALVEQSRTLAPAACAVEQAGTDGKRVWAICRMTEGTTAGQWLLEHGRFPHEAVWQIAFEIAQHLTTLERQGITHGDLGAAGLLLTVRGEVLLPMPGLRGLLRPREGFSCSELQPAAYDYLAPERVVEGSAPTTSSDVYAFAALCWHLLAGRPPIAGGTSVTKLKNIQRAKIADVRQLAPQTPPRLAQTIARCLARDPAERPTSFQAVLEMLGTPPPSAAMALRDCLNRREATWQTLGRPPARRRKSRVRPLAQAGPWVALALFAAAIPWWLHSRVPESPKIAGNQVAKQKQNVATDAALPPAVESSAAAATPMDRQVVKASAAEPLPAPKVDLWEIPAGSVLTAADIELRPGMRVKAAPGPRPRVELSAEPLRIDCDGVCFEGIDFVLSDSGEKKGTPAPRTMLEVNAPSIEFRGCSFVAWTTTPPTAILWLGSDDSFAEPGSATLTDCV